MKILSLVFLLALPLCGRAALGDSESESAEKFGPSIRQTASSGVGDKMLFYEKGGLGIGVEYWNGRAACMFFKKTLRSEKFTDAEIEAILDDNRDGSYWEVVSRVVGEGRKWARKDGGAVADYLIPQGLLIVMTDSFALQRMKNKAAAGEKK